MKKTFLSLLVVSLLLLGQVTAVLAVESAPPDADPNRKSAKFEYTKDGNKAEDAIVQSSTGDLIELWGGGLMDAGSLKVDYDAYTDCYYFTEKGQLTFYLQQWTGSTWSTIRTNTYTDYNRVRYYKGYLYSVPSSGYYRLKVTHYVEDGGLYEYQYGYTDSVYVD